MKIKSFLIKIKDLWYLIIPLCCICFWALIALIKDNFTLIPAADFPTFYYVAQYIFTQPEQIYFIYPQPYPYTSFLATILAPMGLLTFEQAHWFYFFLILILTEFCLIFINQILILKKFSNKFHRFLFLFALSNGIIFMQMFDCLTGRIFTAFGLLWFLKREIKCRESKDDLTDTKFIFSQMMILVFALGVTPQYAFLALLYLFYNVNFKDILSKTQLKKYGLLIGSFFIQNFMMVIIFFISPEAIINFFGGSYRGGGSTYYPPDTLTYSYIVQNEIRDPISGILIMIHVLSLYFDMSSVQINYFFLSIILMSIITILIHSCKSLSIEKKFGLWALLSLFFYGFTQNRYFVGLLPLIALLLTDREIIESRRLIEFLRKNFLTILGLTCLLTLYLMPPVFYLARLFPFIQYIPIVLMFLRYIFIYLIIVLVVMLLHKEEILNLKNSIAKLRNQKKTNENE